MRKINNYVCVWDALADTPGESAHLRARSEMNRRIANVIQREGWTQTEAAKRCGLT